MADEPANPSHEARAPGAPGILGAPGRARRSVRARSVAAWLLVVIAVALGGVSAGSFGRRALDQRRQRGDRADATSQIIAAFAAIGAQAGDEPIGYWLAQPMSATIDPSLSGMYFMAQRAVAPHVLQPESNQRWVLLIGVTPQSLPQQLQQRRAKLVRWVPPNTAFAERLP